MGIYRLTIHTSGQQIDANILSKAIYYADTVVPKISTTLSLKRLPYLALPKLESSIDETIDNLKELERLCKGKVALVGIQYDVSHKNTEVVEFLKTVIEETQIIMLNICLKDHEFETVSSIVNLLKELEASWIDYARIVISTNNILTANLPLSTTKRDSFTVSLNVLDYIKLVEDLRTELKSKITKLYSDAVYECTKLSKEIKLNFTGVDTSLISGERLSLVQFIEMLKDLPFYSVGTINELLQLSNHLSSLKLKKGINLGKYILSYPNDLTLNNYASMETLTLKDFAYLTISPIIGLDMLVIPSWISNEVLIYFFKEINTLSQLIRKDVFVRIVLADAEPGERVSIGEYDVTVIEPLL